MTKRAVTGLIAMAVAIAFAVAVTASSLGAGAETHVMPDGQTMPGGSMTAPSR